MAKKVFDWFSISGVMIFAIAIIGTIVKISMDIHEGNEVIRQSCKQETTSNKKLCGCIKKYDSVDFCVEQYGDY